MEPVKDFFIYSVRNIHIHSYSFPARDGIYAVEENFLLYIFNLPNFYVVSHKSAAFVYSHKLLPDSNALTEETLKIRTLRIYLTVKESILTSRSGKLNSIFLSNLPGLISAGSRVSGLFVAISTLMLPRGSKPSNWLISSSMVRCTSLSPPAPSSKRAPGERKRERKHKVREGPSEQADVKAAVKRQRQQEKYI